ncbi:phospho-N-acetylmuramoyl-pentapeptide-transferase [Acidaminobacter sp. JC074]|nr:phospho-N-acetylmuramoyl-pentapeptide-transferase [Acidaminobacter sp. JC074]
MGLIALITYILSVLLGPMIIEYFKRLSVRQVVREEGLESHHKKTGTPTMGGFIFLVPAILMTLVSAFFLEAVTPELIAAILATILFGAVGFIDDYRKVIRKHNEGLKSREKLIGQLMIALPLALFATYLNPELWIPFTNIYWDLGWLKAFVVLFVVIATTNAVNLTDGVDGLSSSVTVLVMAFFVFVGIKFDMQFAAIFAASLIGGLVGFIFFNRYPAKIFMGDIGSLALGGAVVSLAIFTNTLLLIPIVGVIYFAETLSVTIQVLYFKKTGKRVFKMSPLHHHYELSGWHETKIVRNFSLVTLVGVVLGMLSLIGRM